MKTKMDNDAYYLWENDRAYLNPTTTRDETMSFVDSLRGTVRQDNADLARSTQNLGTNISPNLGGLTGSEGYFAQRYQTTPVEYQVNTLKATAQADALNKLMANYKNQAANRYNQAYRSYQRNNNNPTTTTTTGETSPFKKEETESTKDTVPPNIEDYYVTGEEQTQKIKERTGLPEFLIQLLKPFGIVGR